MGTFERAVEPTGSSAQLFVSDRDEEVAVGSLGERMGDCIVEPTCEGAVEHSGSSPQLLVGDRVEEVGVGSLGERMRDCIVETLLSVDDGLGASSVGEDGLVLQSVVEKMCCSDSDHVSSPLEAQEGKTMDECRKPKERDLGLEVTTDVDCGHHDVINPKVGNMSSIELGLSRICFDETQCKSDPCSSNHMDCSGKWVEPISSLDNDSQGLLKGSEEHDLQCVSEKYCCLDSDHGGLGLLDAKERDTTDGYSLPDDRDKNVEVAGDFDHNHADVNHELGNVSSIQLGLSRVCFDEIQCESEMNPCPSDQIDYPGQHQVSKVLDDARNGSTAQNKPGYNASGDNPYRQTPTEVVSNSTLTGAVADGSSESMAMLDESTLNYAAVNFTYVAGSSDHVEKEAEGNDRIDAEMCKMRCLDAPSSSLRRSSRTRKSVQNVQGEKHATKSTKKASILSRCAAIDLFSSATRKKRSCLSRSLCSCSWGLSGNLSKYFDLSNEVTIDKVLGEVSKRGKSGHRSKNKDMLKVVASSQMSEGIQGVPCRPIRLKVTFGKKEEQKKVDVMPPEAVDAPAVLQSDDGSKPALCSYVEGTAGKSTCTDSVQLEPPKLAGSHADKYMDSGTSPDSEVIDRVFDSNVAQSALTFLHNPLNITSNGTAVSGNVSSLLPCKKSKKKSNKKDKLCEASDICMEDKVLSQSGVDKAKKKKRNKKDKLYQASNPGVEDKVPCQVEVDKAEVDKAKSKKGGRQKKSSGSCFKGPGITTPSENSSGSELLSTEQLSVSEKGPHNPSLDNGADSNVCSPMLVGIESADSGNPCRLLSSDEVQEKTVSKGSKAKGKSRTKSKLTDTTKKEEEPCGKTKSDKRKGKSKCKVSEYDSLDEAYSKGSQSQKGKYAMLDVRETDTGNGVVPENVSCLDVLPAECGKQILPPRSAWVCCDDCLKWRCIPAELADAIEDTNCRWTCKDNQDQAFADCSIPQEKTNAEINAELQISDEEDGRDGHLGSKGIRNAIASQVSTWMLINSNLFLHRSRKTQTMDEIMVCHCKLSEDGSLGCGNQCLNRMLNIECVQGTCPCGDLCSNQQFQKQQYAKLNWFRCGKKGYGLQAVEDISRGQFLIEYVGEVLDVQSYEARQQDYASKGYKHFYFMTLNGNEVIDACAKGNLGRFVNHSCDPNCRTEKWVVNGEICVGLFALRSIRKGEELTFDYNYVRVFGAAAKKCHCGSLKCRGYIGGDPNNSEVIVQADSDEEFPEPVVINENGEIDRSLEDVVAEHKSQDVELVPNADDLCDDNLEVIIEDGEKVNKIDVGSQSPALTKKVESDEVLESLENLTAFQTEHVRNETVSTVDQLQSTREHTISTSISSPTSDDSLVKNMVKKSVSGSTDSSGRISEVDTVEHERSPSKPRPRTKISRPSKSVKNRKSNSNPSVAEKVPVTGHKSQGLSYKPRKLQGGSANCNLEAVEEKLNELLDADGGICKRKDASKGYLKLLLLTAASGDSGTGGAIQSNRDLSMILDAMLKTKSRGLLLDIINKNGLQMLHNMMKLYRRDFKKIPILRKLLKVLEFLAEKEILTVERINGAPLRPGVESFRQSILSFTEHEDKKVHQIARSFRDTWIPRAIRKFNGRGKADRKREFDRSSNPNRFFGNHHQRREHGVRQTEAIDCIKQSTVSNNPIDVEMQEVPSVPSSSCNTTTSQTRKRKSRWDQDKEPKTSPQKITTSPKVVGKSEEGVDQRVEEHDERSFPPCPQNLPEPTFKADDPMQTSEDDAPPPGFSSPHILEEDDPPPGFWSLRRSEDAPPPGFTSLSPHSSPPLQCPPSVSKGFIQERFDSHLPVSYGIPFSAVQHFGTLDQSGTTVDSWVIAPSIPFQPFPPLPPYPREKGAVENQSQEEMRRDQGIPSTSGFVQPNLQNTRPPNQHMFHREKGFRRNYQQQRWNNNNHTKWKHPWHRRRNGWGFKGNHNHQRNRMFMEQQQNGQLLVDVNHSVEFAGNSC